MFDHTPNWPENGRKRSGVRDFSQSVVVKVGKACTGVSSVCTAHCPSHTVKVPPRYMRGLRRAQRQIVALLLLPDEFELAHSS